MDIEFLDLPGERIPLADSSIDTVVSTFTLCTIPGVVDAIRGIVRVLKAGGHLIFLEISVSPEPRVRRCRVPACALCENAVALGRAPRCASR